MVNLYQTGLRLVAATLVHPHPQLSFSCLLKQVKAQRPKDLCSPIRKSCCELRKEENEDAERKF